MFGQKKQRGATRLQDPPRRLSRRYLPAVAAGIALATLSLSLILPGDPEPGPEPVPAVPAAVEVSTPAALATAPTAPVTAEPAQPAWQEQQVKSGDNLSRIFKRAGYSDRELYRFVNEAPEGSALGKLYPGQTIAFQADQEGELAAVRHIRSPLETTTYRKQGDEFTTDHVVRTPEVRRTWTSGEIDSSLYLAGHEAGLSDNLIMELANIFGGVIDFILDPRKGDRLYLLYEELYLDGEKFRDGEIIAATFINQGEAFNAFRYQDTSGDTGYYNEEGVSMRKAFLMAPLDFTRISSNFNLHRKHPIYGTVRAHRGTDYAAPTGTPVFAAGDGRVTQAGYSRANGNYVFIQHGEQYVTKYLHLHKRRVKTGQRVTQSQVIGTVGSTGSATGPHLHYEFLVNGVHRNPRTIHKQLPKAKALAAAEMPRFRESILGASTQLASLQGPVETGENSGAGD